MVKNPRAHRGRSDSDEAIDLLRALARKQRGPARTNEMDAPSPPQSGEPDKMEALRALAQKLDRQLRKPGETTVEMPSRVRRPRAAWIAATAAAVVAVLALLGLLIWKGVSPQQAVLIPPVETQAPAPAQAPPKADPATVSKAMADCDAAAAQDRDGLYFLILPMLPASKTDRSWAALALQTVGNSFILLSSKDALDGIANNTLMLRPGRYTFAVLDTESGATYSWTSATGLSRLSKGDAGAAKTLKLGFDFSEAQTGPQWTAEFRREPGSCYWVSVLVRE
jgi:hypothetical protein